MDQLDKYEYTDADAIQQSKQVVNNTVQNMEKIRQNLLSAIHRIPTWSTPLLRIIPQVGYDSIFMKGDFTQPSDSALIEFGQEDMSPNFSYFVDGDNIDIDDVLEFGDNDFFENKSNTQNDYFMLIREIKNPRSTQTAGRFLKLYTARPSSDRNIYMDATTVPGGIFLADNLYHVEGLSVDFGGNRDIWKVVINEQYLFKTFNAPEVRYYQVVGDGMVPVKRLDLLSRAEDF
jgi:hypothetical protein